MVAFPKGAGGSPLQLAQEVREEQYRKGVSYWNHPRPVCEAAARTSFTCDAGLLLAWTGKLYASSGETLVSIETVTLRGNSMVGQAAQQPAVDVDLEQKLSSFGNVSHIRVDMLYSEASGTTGVMAAAPHMVFRRIVGSTDVPCTFAPETYSSVHAASVQVSFVLASARDPDMPILYASPSFYELTGFSPQEVVGHNCR